MSLSPSTLPFTVCVCVAVCANESVATPYYYFPHPYCKCRPTCCGQCYGIIVNALLQQMATTLVLVASPQQHSPSLMMATLCTVNQQHLKVTVEHKTQATTAMTAQESFLVKHPLQQHRTMAALPSESCTCMQKLQLFYGLSAQLWVHCRTALDTAAERRLL